MRRWYLAGAGLLATAVIALFGGGVSVAGAQGEPPAAHAAITEYTGPETCAQCHITVAQDVVESLHYQQQAAAPFLDGADEEINYGMFVTY